MKIAAISDIHGNLAALQAVMDHIDSFRPDFILVAGDIINRGPMTVPCWEMIWQRADREGWRLLYGNHEEYVLEYLQPDVEHRPATYWTVQQMGTERIHELMALPFSQVIAAQDGSELRAYHASIHNSQDGIYPWTSDEDLYQKVDPDASIFVTAHTHRPLVRELDQMLVVNTGSVGAPFDGDVRASYAQITWHSGRWQAKIVRVPYDRAQTSTSYHDSGFIYVEPVTQIHYYEWYYARPLYPFWDRLFAPRIKAGELSVNAALREFVNSVELPDTHLVPL